MRAIFAFLLVGLLSAVIPSRAAAHVAVKSGPGFAGKTQAIDFEVGHGCEGADTESIRIVIPAEVSAVRAIPSAFGAMSVETDADNRVVAVTWQKSEADLLPRDMAAYILTLRVAVPNAPFTRLYFPTYQTCKKEDGTSLSAEWIARPGEEGDPAPDLLILPARTPGWNKMTVPSALEQMQAFFSDAVIVWKGNAAYSANEHTAAQIDATEGVGRLSSLAAGDEIWVRY